MSHYNGSYRIFRIGSKGVLLLKQLRSILYPQHSPMPAISASESTEACVASKIITLPTATHSQNSFSVSKGPTIDDRQNFCHQPRCKIS